MKVIKRPGYWTERSALLYQLNSEGRRDTPQAVEIPGQIKVRCSLRCVTSANYPAMNLPALYQS
jgi:hypothetical protein